MPRQARDLHPSAEFAGADLGDPRLERRLKSLVERAGLDPSASLPTMTVTDSEREAAYRFLNNERVQFDAVMQPHFDLSAERAEAAKTVLAIHDTSTFKLAGSRGDELGYINTGARGFFLHTTIAVENSELRRCLGVLKATTLFRETPPAPKTKKRKTKKMSGAECAALEDRESARWWEHVESVEKALNGRCDVIHVADCEADNYALLANMRASKCRVVVRMARDRRARADAEDPWSRVSLVAGASNQIAEREVPLSARGSQRPPKALKKFPPRESRLAKLRFSAMPLRLKRPQYLDDRFAAELEMNVVRVYETDAPKGEEPVEWFLFTSEPTSTEEEVLAVVDIYRRRWVIEDFFRAVKTGCAYEERQLEGRHAWLIALAITLPLAWRLLELRNLARSTPTAPATTVLTTTEVEVLQYLQPRSLSARPTLREALLAVAAMGGHIKNNGEPGWLVLHRGLSKLQPLAEGVELGRAMRSEPRNL